MERLAGRVILLGGWRRSLAAFLAGAFAVLAQAPFDFFAACLVSFPVLVWLLDGAAGEPGAGMLRRLAPSFATGWWFGFGYFVAGLWWVGNAVLVEGEGHAWALPLAVLALPAGLALFYGLATALARLVWSDDIGRIAALAAGFGIAEWLRAVLFTGFPWNAIGYAAMPVPLLMQSVSVTGLYGMNALAVFVFAMPALLAGRRHRALGLALALSLAAAHAGYGYFSLARAPATGGRTLAVRIVQPSIDQAEKWDASVRERIFGELIELTRRPPAAGTPRPQLIVWPETSVPFILTQRPEALSAIGEALADDQTLFAGAVRTEGDAASSARYYNSVTAIDGSGQIVDAVDKRHLVPFGEYLPFAGLFGKLGLGALAELPGPFSAGADRHPIVLPGGLRALPFICYEIIFPEEGRREAAASDLAVNVTNDAWFGDTPGPYQHLRQAQVRAVEFGLPLVRAANNGISAAIDAHGRVLDALAMNAVGVLDAALPLAEARNLQFGTPRNNGFFILIALAVLRLAVISKLKRRIN